jgi:apolipoprotein N-acyltransferase
MSSADVLDLPGTTARGLRRKMLLAGLAGAFGGLGQAPVSLPWATLIGLYVAFFLYLRADRAKAAAWIGWAFGAGYFAATLFWIVEPFMVDAAREGWMAPFALVGMAGGLALFWGLAAGIAFWLGRGRWTRALALAVMLSAAELARSYVLTGFPWALIGHVWVDWAPMQLAAWVGPVGLTVLTVLLVAGLVAGTWMQRGLWLLPFAALYAAGAWQAALPIPARDGVPQVVRLIQPNAAQHLKWDPEFSPQFFARQLEFTAAPAEVTPDLVIWPETSVPQLLNYAQESLRAVAKAAGGVPVVLGIQRIDGFAAYNSMIVLNGAGRLQALYDKYHLVPFGEYIPAGWLLNGLGLSAFTAQEGFGYSAGTGPQLLNLGPLGRVLPLICYEAIFPQDVRASATRPDWLLQITNDAWFGNLAGPQQHLAQARLRAVEMGLPFVRVANTGVSAVIDARGQVLQSLPLGQAGYLDATLPPPLPATLYARMGDLPIALLLFCAGLLLLGLRFRKTD